MSADVAEPVAFQDQPISQLLVKVATRCNIDCSYCYWFRDAAVYDKAKLMGAAVVSREGIRLRPPKIGSWRKMTGARRAAGLEPLRRCCCNGHWPS